MQVQKFNLSSICILKSTSFVLILIMLLNLIITRSPSAILRNEVGWYDEEEHNSSLLASKLATDAADVKSAIAERISVILQNMTSLLTSFIVAFIVEWRVSLLILATFPLLVLANFAQVCFTVAAYYAHHDARKCKQSISNLFYYFNAPNHVALKNTSFFLDWVDPSFFMSIWVSLSFIVF